MHELALTQAILAQVTARCGEARIARVIVSIGKLSGVMPDAVRFCFPLVAEATTAANATLEVLEPDGRARCRACGREVTMESLLSRCACGGTDLDWLAGQELAIVAVEVV
jgi:hydrogenase nickel incorporation protein HypA/HybF